MEVSVEGAVIEAVEGPIAVCAIRILSRFLRTYRVSEVAKRDVAAEESA